MELRWFLCGWRQVTVQAGERTEMFDRIYRAGLGFRCRRMNPDGSVTMKMRERDVRVLSRCGEFEGKISDVHGLPEVLAFIRYRPAIALGFVVMLLWLWHSSRLIWDVRVVGNSKTPAGEITALLEELGCGIGDNFHRISFNDVHAQYLARQSDIAWLSVYMNGTVAEVQVRELYRDERNLPPEGTFADVVAVRPGIVEEVHVRSGTAAVKAGDTVIPGQVLISGVTELKDGSFLYEYADGEVICRTFSVLRADASVQREVKRYTGREKCEISVKFFKKSLNLFRKGGFDAGTCDTINMMEQVCPFGMRPLPVWIFKTVYREYELVTETIPSDDAAAEAMLEMSGKIKDETEGAELVGREITTELEDGVYRISCLLYLRRDNGQIREFRLEP